MRSTSQTVPTRADLARLGQQVIVTGELKELRSRIGMTRNAAAKLIPVSADALGHWEEGTRAASVVSATRVGEWFWGAREVLEDLERSGFTITDWVPISKAAKYLGLPQEEVERRCDDGDMRCESFGILGTWVAVADVPALAGTR